MIDHPSEAYTVLANCSAPAFVVFEQEFDVGLSMVYTDVRWNESESMFLFPFFYDVPFSLWLQCAVALGVKQRTDNRTSCASFNENCFQATLV